MEQSNRIQRSEVWEKIYKIVKQIPTKAVDGDCMDAPSAATEIEELFLKLLPIQNVSVSFLSEGMANKIYKQIGLLAEKQGGITGITTLNQLPSWLQNFMKELAADYGRQIDFLKSVLANER